MLNKFLAWLTGPSKQQVWMDEFLKNQRLAYESDLKDRMEARAIIDASNGHKYEELLPDWAESLANGNYRHIHCALPTRDGRRTGNAVNGGVYKNATDDHDTVYNIITDAGNIIHCLETEMEELFYPPKYVMREMLSIHTKAACRQAARDRGSMNEWM